MSNHPSLRRARQRNVVRRRLTNALHECDSLVLLREEVVNALCDWDETDLLDPVDSSAETERGFDTLPPPSTETESAPSVEIESALGREYGDRAPTDEGRR